MKLIKTLGIDLAQNTFSLVGMNKHGKMILRKTLSRKKLPPFIVQLNPCFIAIEAYSRAYYWARKFKSVGHQVTIIAA